MPITALLVTLVVIIALRGASAVQDISCFVLCGCALLSLVLGLLFTRRAKCILPGIAKSARQILPAVPILLLIGTLSATWMLSGVVPAMIHYGLDFLSPSLFLFLACLTCAVISVLTGSSWTTIATIGVALMGVGTVIGFHPGWVAGAIISGAYFGDKVSPLSDTTVLASSTCGVPLFSHIRFLMFTSIPAITVALAVYLVVGLTGEGGASESHAREMTAALDATFRISPKVMIIPAITLVMIACRLKTWITLGVSSLAGLAGVWIFQPQMVDALCGAGSSTWEQVMCAGKILLTSTEPSTGNALLDPLVATGGAAGMLPTVFLVLSAMLFGGMLIGTGMLGTITHAITRRLRRPSSLVGTTVLSGLFLNSCTGDQYLSIIIGGNVFKNTYKREGLKPNVLSRTLEDSISVTSVLIPWNSCGVTQSTVLGVATVIYFPFCLFNILSPLFTIAMALHGKRLHLRRPVPASGLSASA